MARAKSFHAVPDIREASAKRDTKEKKIKIGKTRNEVRV